MMFSAAYEVETDPEFPGNGEWAVCHRYFDGQQPGCIDRA